MDREHVMGFAGKAKGAAKESAGKIGGDEKLKPMSRLIRPTAPPAKPPLT